MPKNSLNVMLKGVDDIFSTEESRQEEQCEQVQQIPIDKLHPFTNHPFKVLDDESMQRTVESVAQFGVLAPLIARPRPEGGYEIVSGHRRQHAAKLAGLETVPVIVRPMDDDAAVVLMVDSNLQREQILPSERAFAYKMKLEALKNQGARSDLTSTQVAQKLSVEKVGEDAGVSKDTIRRFIRLTSLKLPVHVRCLIDEAANIGQIPNLEKLVATIRSREISACLVLQAKSQLKAIYKDHADTIIGNMDSQIFLGGSEPGTLKDLSEMLGKETIDAFNTSDTRGNSPSYGTNYSKLGHELLSRDEIAVLDGGKCILQLRGVRPFLSDKYDLTQHPNYKLTSDYDPKNKFDIEKYLNHKEKIHPGDEFIVVDADSLTPSA